jgi:4-diphosphocytidyl-2-C-methyl-D-erythritol kinase
MNDRTKFITYLSPAKLNLGLRVVGKRNDGYHLLNTIFCLIDLFDEIHLQILDKPQISLIEHQQAWSYTTDLAYKAAKLLKQETQCTFGVNIKIKKTIPSGAGLGGGSSNAATVLVALNHLWQLNLSKDRLIELGRKLGADVPFFIYGQNAFATGIGDEFSPITLTPKYFVLIKPEFHIPTKNIFASIDSFSTELITAQSLLNAPQNDLQAIAIKLFPRLEFIINQLAQFGKPLMTGSGSTIYLSFTDIKSANKVAQEIGKSYNTYLVKSLSHSPVFTMSL